MVKGYKREVVVLRGTERDCFTEAYFLLKEATNKPHSDLVTEAHRILSDCSGGDGKGTERKGAFVRAATWFFLGVGVTLAVCGLVCLL